MDGPMQVAKKEIDAVTGTTPITARDSGYLFLNRLQVEPVRVLRHVSGPPPPMRFCVLVNKLAALSSITHTHNIYKRHLVVVAVVRVAQSRRTLHHHED